MSKQAEVKKVYTNLFKILVNEFHSSYKAYNYLLEFLIIDNSSSPIRDLDSNLLWFFQNKRLAKSLTNSYKLDLIKDKELIYDYLGDIYAENVVKGDNVLEFCPTPDHIADFQCRFILAEKKNKMKEKEIIKILNRKKENKDIKDLLKTVEFKPVYDEFNILDPFVGSGRFLLKADKYAPNSCLFGVDLDIMMIRTAFTNAVIYNIPMLLLNANSLLHNTDLSSEDGRYNWRFANRWDSHIRELKEKKVDKEESKKVRKIDKNKKIEQRKLF
jgi:hypothetical protein